MWTSISAQLHDDTRGTIDLKVRREGNQLVCVATIGGKRFEEKTYGDLWGLILQKVSQQALDSPPFEATPLSKLEKRKPQPLTQPRRRAIRPIAISSPPET